MTALVPLVLLSWIAVALVLFTRLPRSHAVMALFVLGVLFLPEIHAPPPIPEAPGPLVFPGFKLTKVNAIVYAVLIASLLFDGKRWYDFVPRWFDLPMLAWCVCPLLSSLANDELGLYDGFSETLDQTLAWGAPYFMGRLYLDDSAGLRALVVGIVLGGLLYIPPCLYEMRASPQLHRLLYGFHQHEFQQSIRLGGYRPMVFMEHGLALGFWMAMAALLAFWLYRTGVVPRLSLGRKLPSLPALWAVLFLAPVAVLCRSSNALALGTAGFMTLFLSRWVKVPILLAVLLVVPPLYIGLRASSAWDGKELTGWLGAYYDEARADSLNFRLENENVLLAKALERPSFGWGGWGRSRVYAADGKDVSVSDGLWIIALGERGFFGLVALCLAVLLPAARFVWLYPPRRWSEPAVAPAAAIAVLLALFMIDCLMNAMVNPVFLLGVGGLTGLTGGVAPARDAAERRDAVCSPPRHAGPSAQPWQTTAPLPDGGFQWQTSSNGRQETMP